MAQFVGMSPFLLSYNDVIIAASVKKRGEIRFHFSFRQWVGLRKKLHRFGFEKKSDHLVDTPKNTTDILLRKLSKPDK